GPGALAPGPGRRGARRAFGLARPPASPLLARRLRGVGRGAGLPDRQPLPQLPRPVRGLAGLRRPAVSRPPDPDTVLAVRPPGRLGPRPRPGGRTAIRAAVGSTACVVPRRRGRRRERPPARMEAGCLARPRLLPRRGPRPAPRGLRGRAAVAARRHAVPPDGRRSRGWLAADFEPLHEPAPPLVRPDDRPRPRRHDGGAGRRAAGPGPAARPALRHPAQGRNAPRAAALFPGSPQPGRTPLGPRRPRRRPACRPGPGHGRARNDSARLLGRVSLWHGWDSRGTHRPRPTPR